MRDPYAGESHVIMHTIQKLIKRVHETFEFVHYFRKSKAMSPVKSPNCRRHFRGCLLSSDLNTRKPRINALALIIERKALKNRSRHHALRGCMDTLNIGAN